MDGLSFQEFSVCLGENQEPNCSQGKEKERPPQPEARLPLQTPSKSNRTTTQSREHVLRFVHLKVLRPTCVTLHVSELNGFTKPSAGGALWDSAWSSLLSDSLVGILGFPTKLLSFGQDTCGAWQFGLFYHHPPTCPTKGSLWWGWGRKTVHQKSWFLPSFTSHPTQGKSLLWGSVSSSEEWGEQCLPCEVVPCEIQLVKL